MPLITLIELQKNKGRANVYLDGRFGFGIDLEDLVKLDLKKGRSLTEAEIKKIVKEAEFGKILAKLLKFATVRPRSEKEIRDWLKRKKVPVGLIPGLFKRLERLNLIDDRQFARWWIEERLEFKPKPERVLFLELRKKGLKPELIKEVLAGFDIDESRQIKSLLNKLEDKFSDLPAAEKKKKMINFLLRKGFSWEKIKDALSLFDENYF